MQINQSIVAKPVYRETLEYQHKEYIPLHPDIYTLDPERHLHSVFLQVVRESKELIPILIQYQQLGKLVFDMEEEMEEKMKREKASQQENEEESDWEFSPEQELIRNEFQRVQREFNSKRREILAKWLTLELPDVYSLDLFTLEFQQKLLQEIEHFSKSVHIHLRPNSMNKFGVVCDEMGLNNFFDTFICEYFTYVARIMHRGSWIIDDHHTFVVQYCPTGDTNLDVHVDDSELTLNICLGKPGFEGGNVFFTGKENNLKKRGDYVNQIGRAILHDGSHMHGARNLTKGERINLIIWCRSSVKRKNTANSINFHAVNEQHSHEN
jgi:hypothetical protein